MRDSGQGLGSIRQGAFGMRERSLRQAIEVMNELLDSPTRPEAARLLARILHERSRARVRPGRDKNSLPGLY